MGWVFSTLQALTEFIQLIIINNNIIIIIIQIVMPSQTSGGLMMEVKECLEFFKCWI